MPPPGAIRNFGTTARRLLPYLACPALLLAAQRARDAPPRAQSHRVTSTAPASSPREPPAIVLQLGHWSDVAAIAFAPDDSVMVTGSLDGDVKLWDPRTGFLERTL